MARKLSDYIPILAAEGIDYVNAADAAGVGTQYQVVTVSGNPQTVTLAKQMANTDYAVLVYDPSGTVNMDTDLNNKTVSSISLVDGGASEVVNVIVIGQLKDQKA